MPALPGMASKTKVVWIFATRPGDAGSALMTQPMKHRFHAIAGPTLGLALLAQLSTIQVQAVMFTFEGTIDYTIGSTELLPAGFTMGTTLRGTVFYDPAQAPFDGNSNPNVGFYAFNNPDGSDYTFSVTGDGHTLSAAPTPSSPFNTINVSNNETFDLISYNPGVVRYDGGSLPNGLGNAEFGLELRDNSATALANDSLPTFAPLLSSFPDNPRFRFYADDGMGNSVEFRATITSLTPVPEPGEWAWIAGGCLGAFALVRRRIQCAVRQ
jgi:hypothetical protein